jgi:DNA polymerase elongation subunit (family B)
MHRHNYIDDKAFETVTTRINSRKPIVMCVNDLAIKTRFFESVLFGSAVSKHGFKVMFCVKDIPLFVDVLHEDPNFKVKLNQNSYVKMVETVCQYPGKRFSTKKLPYTRVHFKTVKRRKEFIERYHGKRGIELANDDNSAIMLVVRELGINTAGWNRLSGYTVDNKLGYGCLLLPSSGIRSIERENSEPKFLVMGWDLETTTSKPDGSAPSPNSSRSKIVMNGIVFRWSTESKAFLKVIITTMLCPEIPGLRVIHCDDERDLLMQTARVIRTMSPDFMAGFNDGGYDWPFIINKCERYQILGKFCTEISPILKETGKGGYSRMDTCGKATRRIKVAASNFATYNHIRCVGALSFDTMIELGKLNKSTSRAGSLNYWLKRYKLESKTDMKYEFMDRIFTISDKAKELGYGEWEDLDEAFKQGKFDLTDHQPVKPSPYHIQMDTINLKNHIDQMDRVAIYCARDSEAVLDLIFKANIINDVREQANLSCTPMSAGFYRAGSIKVSNILAKYALQTRWGAGGDGKLAFPMYTKYKHEEDKPKYKGAYVFKPIKGCYGKTLFEKRYYRRYGTVDPLKVNPQLDTFDKTLLMRDSTIAKKIGVNHKPHFDEELDYGDHPVEDKSFWCGYFKKISTRKMYNDINDKWDTPISGDDFSSLYPSIIRAYNLSPDTYVATEEQAKELEKLGFRLIKTETVYKRENEVVSPENTYVGWFVQHLGLFPEETRYKYMGIFAYVLDQLYNKRKKLKKLMGYWKGGLELIRKDIHETNPSLESITKLLLEKQQHYEANAEKLAGKKRELEIRKAQKYQRGIQFFQKELTDTYSELVSRTEYKFMYYNTKQLAIKVLMNTFYGAAGSSNNSLFIVALSGGVTQIGRQSVKKAESLAKNQDFTVYYGDTDSIYISPPIRDFRPVIGKYVEGRLDKEELYENMVAITMDKMGWISEHINNVFFKETNTRFLTLAYEEVTFPMLLTGKKKYAAIEHLSSIDFTIARSGASFDKFNREMFCRGLDLVKRDVSPLAKEYMQRVLFRAFCLDEPKMLSEIIEDEIQHLLNRKLNINDLAKSYSYRKTAKGGNVCVMSFVSRMEGFKEMNIGIEVPTLGSRFRAVKVLPNKLYDFTGRKIRYKTGDLLEYPSSLTNDRYLKIRGKLEIDKIYYLEDVFSKFARLLSYHPEWCVFDDEDLDDEQYKEAERKAVDRTKKMLIERFSPDKSRVANPTAHFRQFTKKLGASQVESKLFFRHNDNEINTYINKKIDKHVPDMDILEHYLKKMDLWKVKTYVKSLLNTFAVIDYKIVTLLKRLNTVVSKNESIILMQMKNDSVKPEFKKVFDEYNDVVSNIILWEQTKKNILEWDKHLEKKCKDHIGDIYRSINITDGDYKPVEKKQPVLNFEQMNDQIANNWLKDSGFLDN